MEITKDLLKRHNDCLIKFTSPSCGACKMLEPVISRLADKSDIKLFTCNISLNDFYKDYSISSLPTIIRFKDGKETHRVVGALSADNIKKQLEL